MNVNDEIVLIPKEFDAFVAASLPCMLRYCQRLLTKNRSLGWTIPTGARDERVSRSDGPYVGRMEREFH
jgi:hypothetical protein